ncbi:MAG: type secretion system protein, partial [Pseudomonadota bacterium]
GGVTRILPEVEAKTQGIAMDTGGRQTVLVTKVFPLKNESATQLLNVVRPLISVNNSVSVYAPTNTLIITDYADNLRKVEALINSLDAEQDNMGLQVIRLQHATANEVAATLVKMFPDQIAAGAAVGGEGRDRLSVVADSRLNAVMLRSDNPQRLKRAIQLLGQLDVPLAGMGSLHVIALKHADAQQLAQTLRRAIGAENQAAPVSGNALSANANSANSMNISGNANALSGLAQPAGMSLPSSSSGNTSPITITADSSNNALIISAPETVVRNLRGIIEALDKRRSQVFIEALVVELSADKAAEFGMQWQALSGLNAGGVRYLGGTSVVNPNAVASTPANLIQAAGTIAASGGLNVGAVREIALPGIGTVYSLAALARALENKVSANVLSVPTLLTLDNEEAKFASGQNVPFVTGQYATSSGSNAVNPFQTIERKDVGLTIKVKPLITDGDVVRLGIYQEVSSISDASTAQTGFITNKRALESNVLVDDGQVVVLGGLLQESLSNGEDKVPLLGDIPLLGNLFKYEQRKKQKTNLLVFLRPTIVRSAAQLADLSKARYERLQQEQTGAEPPPAWFWPETTSPSLPFKK